MAESSQCQAAAAFGAKTLRPRKLEAAVGDPRPTRFCVRVGRDGDERRRQYPESRLEQKVVVGLGIDPVPQRYAQPATTSDEVLQDADLNVG